MSPENLVVLILGILGVILQLALKYAPKVSAWYEVHPQKGLVALAASVVIGAVYFGLSCTPYAAQFRIALSCNQDGAFTLINSIFIIATSQQMTYLVTRR